MRRATSVSCETICRIPSALEHPPPRERDRVLFNFQIALFRTSPPPRYFLEQTLHLRPVFLFQRAPRIQQRHVYARLALVAPHEDKSPDTEPFEEAAVNQKAEASVRAFE